MMEEYYDDLPDNVVPPAMKISGNKKVTNYAELVQELTEQDWQEIYWLEEHVANVSYES